MKIDVSKEMQEPTEAEIQQELRGFMIYNIRRNRVMRSICEQLKARQQSSPLKAIYVSLAMAKEMSEMFVGGRLAGAPVRLDPALAEYELWLDFGQPVPAVNSRGPE